MTMIAGRCFLVTDQNGTFSAGDAACKEESSNLKGKWDAGLATENEQEGVSVKKLYDVFHSCMTILYT